MKAVKISYLFILLIVFTVMSSCGKKDKAVEVREVMKKNLQVMEEFIEAVEGTDDVQAYLSALRKMKSEVQNLVPEMKKLDEKYPELFKLGENKEPSPELKEILKELIAREVEIRSKFVASLQKMMKNSQSPELIEELKEIMGLMDELN